MSTSETVAGTDTRTVVQSYFEALGRRDRDAQDAWYADSASVRLYGVIGPTGKSEMRQFFHDMFDAVPDFSLQILDLVVEDDRAAVRWHITGTFSGTKPLEGLLPTGKPIDIEGCDMFWAKDGKIVRIEAYYDTASMARQVGALPPKGSAAEKGLLGAVNLGTRAKAEIEKRRGS